MDKPLPVHKLIPLTRRLHTAHKPDGRSGADLPFLRSFRQFHGVKSTFLFCLLHPFRHQPLNFTIRLHQHRIQRDPVLFFARNAIFQQTDQTKGCQCRVSVLRDIKTPRPGRDKTVACAQTLFRFCRSRICPGLTVVWLPLR